MQAIAIRTGTIIGWVEGVELFALDGHAIGFVRGRGVFSNAGELQGYFQGSAFRDDTGKLVATVDSASWKERLPVLQSRPSCDVPTEWPPQVPSLDQWSPHWRTVFGTHAAEQVDEAQTASAL
jgi:hypothetical protein